MAFRHGRLAELSINAVLLSTFTDSMDVQLKNSPADTTTFGAAWKTAIPGLNDGTVAVAGDYDPTTATGPAYVFTQLLGAAPFACVAYPGGNVAGQEIHTFSAILTDYKENSKVSDKVTWAATLLMTGADTITIHA